MNQLKLLEKGWKAGLAVLTASVLAFGGLFLSLTSSLASGTPNMTVRMVVNDDNDVPDQGWQHTLSSQAGHRISFAVEIHNTVVGTEARDVHVAVGFPSGVRNTLNIPVNISANNANNASDSVAINVTSPVSGAEIRYVPHSTRLYWDRDGDGVREYNNTPLVDGIVGGGLTLGDQKGCNEFIIQVTFLAELVAGQEPEPSPSPSPTPTPSATPSPTPTPPAGQSQSQSQSQTQNNTQTQTVNVTTAAAPAPQVAGVKKQPETGVGVLGMAAMFSAAPIGLVLARYGRGRIHAKRDEELIVTANSIFSDRQSKKSL